MLRRDAAALLEEVNAAEKLRDRRLARYETIVHSIYGTQGRGAPGGQRQAVENHAFEYVSLMVPRLVFTHPRVRVESRRAGELHAAAGTLSVPGAPGGGGEGGAEQARLIRAFLTRWFRDSEVLDTLRRCAPDFLICYAVAFTAPKPMGDPSAEATPWLPWTWWLNPMRFFMDGAATVPHEARFMGHLSVDDVDSLLELAEDPESGWDRAAIEAAAGKTGEPTKLLGRAEDAPLSRKEIAFREVWVPEHQMPGYAPEEGWHGTIYTLSETEGGTGVFLREPRPYFGPAWGPYTIFGAFEAPLSPYPYGPLEAVQALVDELNQQVRAANDGARTYKRIVVYDSGVPELGRKLRETPHDFVVGVQGLQKNEVQVFEIGGVTAQQLEQVAILRDRLDRVSGVHDAQRGNLESGTTATAVAVAESASGTRNEQLRASFERGVQRIARTAAWYAHVDDRVRWPLGRAETAELVGREVGSATFYGGVGPGERVDDFDALEFEIEPYSLARTTDASQQRRAIQALGMVGQVLPLVMQFPEVGWEALVQDLGDAINSPDLATRLGIAQVREKAAALQQMAAQAAMAPAPGPGLPPGGGGGGGVGPGGIGALSGAQAAAGAGVG